MLSVSTFPLLERQAVPVDMAMTVEAVFVKPDHGTHLFFVGSVKTGAT
jgi:hypothetical protein